jgi:hypothetical protein
MSRSKTHQVTIYHSFGPIIADVVNRSHEIPAVPQQVRPRSWTRSHIQNSPWAVFCKHLPRKAILNAALVMDSKGLVSELRRADFGNIPSSCTMNCRFQNAHSILSPSLRCFSGARRIANEHEVKSLEIMSAIRSRKTKEPVWNHNRR